MNKSALLIGIGFIFPTLFGGFASLAATSTSSGPFPPFDLPVLSKTDNAPAARMGLKDFAGHPVVVDMWASWCEPCKLSMPVLNEIYLEFKEKGVMVVGWNVDEDLSIAQKFAKKLKVDFPLVSDTQGMLSKAVPVIDRIPFTLFIDKDGKIVAQHYGFNDKYKATIREKVLALMKSTGSAKGTEAVPGPGVEAETGASKSKTKVKATSAPSPAKNKEKKQK
jgi:thiol-disulfide isomerase/thioredoxin